MSDLAINPAGNGSVNHLRPSASLHHASSPSPVDRTSRIPGRADFARQSDRVELSDRARLLDRMRDLPDVRQDRVDRVRAAIARGGYDSDMRINSAIDRLIEQEDMLH
jgi:flagellar biosynthesis anti-sigma factor FlgM